MGHRQAWLILFMCILCAAYVSNALGVNWGTQMSHALPLRTMVSLLKANNVDKVKLFDSDTGVLRALANTGIEVMVGIPNVLLISMADSAQANSWVQDNVVRFKLIGTKIRYVAVGDEPFNQGYNDTYSGYIYPALKNIQHALINVNTGGDQVKATIPLNADILSHTFSPSQAAFREDIAQDITQIAGFLAQNNCPFIVNINPFLDVFQNKSSVVDDAFFDREASPVVDGQYIYHNVFDASYDSLVVALSKVGYDNMSIIVGAIGWPTDGDMNANTSYARRFNQGFVNHVASSKGTPRQPNTDIDFYMLSLIDEDMKDVTSGNFERHWGIFRYDGRPKYPLSLGYSNADSLVEAVGVQYLMQQWCVLDTSIVDISTLPDSVSYACDNADCTALGYGCSCYNYLNASGNASYAFNAYFQRQNQDVGACSFNGLGRIVTENPSNSTCEFIIQLAYGSSGSSPLKVTWKQAYIFLMSLMFMAW